MDSLLIKGGKPLEGVVSVRGSKNAASKLMVASLLTSETCVLENVPLSEELNITKELCMAVGGRVEMESDHALSIRTEEVKNSVVLQLSRKNRIPVLAFGPLLHRRGFAEIPVLGGCPIGHRPVNFHIEALSKMGAKIERRENSYYAEAKRLCGAEIEFPFSSVGATENVLLAGTLAEGRTVIKNAAVEPEIINIIEMLNLMGAKVSLYKSQRMIIVEGVSRLKGARIRVIPDRNEAVSFASAAIATGGRVLVEGIDEKYLIAFLGALRKIGAGFGQDPKGINFWGTAPLRATNVATAPHPGFMTDWQQPFAVLLTQAQGTSIIHETVYEDRFGYTKDLVRMGAEIFLSDDCPPSSPCRFSGETFNHVASITGPSPLHGAEIRMTDIRAGMANIIAALAAEGDSVVTGVEHLDRGYEDMDGRLRSLGADITRRA